MSRKFFPVILIVLDLAAAARYAFDKDIRHTLYWLFAAGLTSAITF